VQVEAFHAFDKKWELKEMQAGMELVHVHHTLTMWMLVLSYDV